MGLKRLRDWPLFLVIALYMLCLPIPSLAGTKALLTQAQARSFALGFCSGPDVALCTDKDRCSVIRQDDLWRCDITTGDAGCVSLLFDDSGRVIQLLCDRYPAASLDGVSLASGLSSLPKEESDAINAICDRLFPGDIWCAGDVIGCKDGTYTLVGDGFHSTLTFYFIVRFDASPRLVGFGDLRHPAGRYGPYLSRAEASHIAREAILRTCPAADGVDLNITQAEFVTAEGYFNKDPVDTPFWFIVFNDGTPEFYEVCIDAKEGDVMELLDVNAGGRG